jgi:hypothetical protein
MGSCTVDRRTGLPLELTRSRYLNLVVTTTAGEAVEQEKRIETTIRAYPEPRGPIVQRFQSGNNTTASPAVPSSVLQSGIQQTSGTSPTAVKSDSAEGLSSTARAVYPD